MHRPSAPVKRKSATTSPTAAVTIKTRSKEVAAESRDDH
jgi:hypothetical protein